MDIDVMQVRRPEYTCPICGRKFDKYKALFGHMMMTHRAEFEEKGRTLSAWGITYDPREKIIRNILQIETAVPASEEVRGGR